MAIDNTKTQFCLNGEMKNYEDYENYGFIEYENQVYRTVVIGTQTWMAENLNYDVSESRCYNDEPDNCDTYGRLYNWATAMSLPSSCNSISCASQITTSNHRGICPSGWHIPSDVEWDALMTTVGDSSVAGRHLKAQSGWRDCSPSGSFYVCSDTYGFSALPGGIGADGTRFYEAGSCGYWWSSTESEYGTYTRRMINNREYASWSNYGKTVLFSVRCVKDP